MSEKLVFGSRVKYGKTVTHPPTWYASPAASVADLIKELPIYISTVDLVKIAKVSIAKGFTQSELYVSFDDFSKQWEQTKKSPLSWRFTGGKVYLLIEIKILVDDKALKSPNRIPIMEVIMPHELHHMSDDIDVVKNELPLALRKTSLVENYLVKRQEIDDGTLQNIFGPNPSTTNEFAKLARSLFAQESSKKAELFHKSAQGSKDIVKLTNMNW